MKHIRRLLTITALASIIYGCHLYSPALGYVVGGMVLLAIAMAARKD